MKKKSYKAFTFFEVILYIALASIVIGILFSYGWNIVSMRVKSATIRDTLAGARLVDERLSQEIRSASSIDSENSNFSAPDEKIAMSTPSGQVVVESNSDKISIKRGDAPAQFLHADNVRIKNLNFFDSGGGSGHVRFVGFSFTAEAYYPDSRDRAEYQYSVNWQGGAEVRTK